MSKLTHAEFKVNDEGGGQDYQEFSFDTYQAGSDCRVQITFPGSGPIVNKLSKSAPTVSVVDNLARVKPTGTLNLVWNDTNKTAEILFSGTLHTNHSTILENVCVGIVDLQ